MLEDNWEIAAMIDERVGQLTRGAVSDTVLVNRMLGYLPALHRLWTSAPDEELAALFNADPGFVRYARLMEEMSESLRTGVGVPPGVTDLPPAEEPVKGLFEGIRATGRLLSGNSSNGKRNAWRISWPAAQPDGIELLRKGLSDAMNRVAAEANPSGHLPCRPLRGIFRS